MSTSTYADTPNYFKDFPVGELRDTTRESLADCQTGFNIVPGDPNGDQRDKLVIVMSMTCPDLSTYEGNTVSYEKNGEQISFTVHNVICGLKNITGTLDGQEIWGRLQISKQQQRDYNDPSRL
jgi:hypothetical protein